MPPALRQRYFRHDRTQAHREVAVGECDKSRYVDWSWKTVGMNFSVAASNSDWFLHVRALEGAH
jgi:hypothetical protein